MKTTLVNCACALMIVTTLCLGLFEVFVLIRVVGDILFNGMGQ